MNNQESRKIYYKLERETTQCLTLCIYHDWKGTYEPMVGSTYCTTSCPVRGGEPGRDSGGEYVLCRGEK